MLPILQTPNLNLTLLHLSEDEQADPVSVIADFCETYSPGDMRQTFNVMQKAALLNDLCNDPRERDSQIFFGDMALKTFEACYLICRDRAPT